MTECEGAWREDYQQWQARRDSIRKMRALASFWDTNFLTKVAKSEMGAAVLAVSRLCAKDLRDLATELESQL